MIILKVALRFVLAFIIWSIISCVGFMLKNSNYHIIWLGLMIVLMRMIFTYPYRIMVSNRIEKKIGTVFILLYYYFCSLFFNILFAISENAFPTENVYIYRNIILGSFFGPMAWICIVLCIWGILQYKKT
jgi:hypothetical protein